LFAMLKVSVSLFASLAVGWKLYATPAATDVVGVPVMVGAEFVEPEVVTVMPNQGTHIWETPSLAQTLMPPNVPAAVGLPLRRPVVELKVAHEGFPWTLNVIALPSGSLATG